MEMKERPSPKALSDSSNLTLNILQKSDSDRKKQVTVRLEKEQYQLVRLLEKQTGVSQAEAVRKLVDKGIQVIE